jgi:hypothetical protein
MYISAQLCEDFLMIPGSCLKNKLKTGVLDIQINGHDLKTFKKYIKASFLARKTGGHQLRIMLLH